MNRRCPVCSTEYPDAIAFCGQDGNVTIRVTPEGQERDARLGEKLGDHIVAAHVADGAMGAVYEARNAETRERVAIKVLHSEVEEDEIAVERFKREYETADMFEHPHIVKVVDFGETVDGQHYMTMEFLQGLELGQLLRTSGAQTPARTLRMLAQIGLALEEAHGFGVIHRDLKPDNVFLCQGEGGDDVRILDFGSVKLQVETGPKLTAFGTTLGSPYYMSPEQAKGLPDVDTRTDVFAMGAIAYEMLSGQIAFEAPTVAEILMKIVRMMPEPIHAVRPSVPETVGVVIEKSIAKKKEERHETPSDFVTDMLAAYGVSGTCAEWAEKSESELAAAIESASPPVAAPAAPLDAPAAADTVPDADTAPEPAPQVMSRPEPAGSLPAPAPTIQGLDSPNRTLLYVGLVVLAVVVLGCLATAVMMMS